MQLKVRLLESNRELKNIIKDALKDDIRKYIQILYIKTLKFLEDDFRDSILISSTYQALASNQGLRTELGLVDGAQRLLDITEEWIKSMYRDSTCGDDSFLIQAVKADYSDVLDLPAAVFHGVSQDVGHYTNRWLSWLLLSGSSTVVTGYRLKYDRPISSRTNDAIMTPGGSFSIPQEYQGTADHNVATSMCNVLTAYFDEKIEEMAKEIKI